MRLPSLLLAVVFGVWSAGSLLAARPILCCDYGGGRVTILSATGEIQWQVQAKNPQDCWQLPNGNILFAYVGGAKEVTRDQKIVWEYKAPEKVECHACQPLPDGNVLVVECGTRRIVEIDRAGKIAKEIKLVTAASVKLPNQFRGTRKTADGRYLGHGHLGEQPQVFEITPDKKVVWTFEDKGRFKTINQIMALDDTGNVTKGEVLR
jgi:hypothetical protein